MIDDAENHIRTILNLSDQLVAVSELGFASFEHDGCLLLNGIVRDCAFRLRDAAEMERVAHLMQTMIAEPAVKQSTGQQSASKRSSPNNWTLKETHHEGA